MSKCARGVADPGTRINCAGWRNGWNASDCVAYGCCWDPHPSPDPAGRPWCFAKSAAGRDPGHVFVDIDYFVATTAADPLTPFVNQGWWGDDIDCHYNHCCHKPGAQTAGVLPFPRDWVACLALECSLRCTPLDETDTSYNHG